MFSNSHLWRLTRKLSILAILLTGIAFAGSSGHTVFADTGIEACMDTWGSCDTNAASTCSSSYAMLGYSSYQQCYNAKLLECSTQASDCVDEAIRQFKDGYGDDPQALPVFNVNQCISACGSCPLSDDIEQNIECSDNWVSCKASCL